MINILETALGLLTQPDNIKNLFSDGGIAESLIKQIDKSTIYAVCITVLALKVNESSTIKAAIEALAAMEAKQLNG